MGQRLNEASVRKQGCGRVAKASRQRHEICFI